MSGIEWIGLCASLYFLMPRLLVCAADAPYLLSEDFLHELFTKHKIDYVVHGDDPCLLPDGVID